MGGLIGTDETTLYLGKSYERIEKAGGEVSHKHFIYAEGQLAAIHIEHEDQHGVIDPTRDETRYLHRDALGSIDTITDGQGIVVERLGYSPYGERRQGDWRTIGGLNLALYTNRGFTGHEHIDEVGLIHMNGRVYDPQLGRFLSADPFVQSPTSSQNYNRYSYALNNPLKYTDPSGYFFKKLFKGIKKAFKKLFKNKIFRVVAAIAGAFFLGPTVGSLLFDAAAAMGLIGSGMMASVTASYVFAGIGGGLVGGLIASGGDFKAGLMGAFTGGAAGFIGISSAFGAVGRVTLGRVVAHGAVGGVSSELSGGKFVRGFLSSAFSKSVSGRMDVLTKGDPIAATVTAAVVGGTASKIAGGKFENGAMTAAFQYLFNHAATRKHEHEHDDPNSSYRVWMEADGRLWFPRKRGVCAPGSTNCDVNALWDDNDLETIMYKKAVEIDRLNQLKLATEAASLMPNKALADVVNKGIQLRIDALRMEIYRRPEWDGMSDAVNDMTIDYLTGKK